MTVPRAPAFRFTESPFRDRPAIFTCMSFFFRSAVIQPVTDALIGLGRVPPRIVADLHVPPSALLDQRAWVDRRACFGMVNAIRRLTGDPCVGIHLAQQADWNSMGSWAAGILAAPNLREAIRHAARALPLLETGSRLELLLRDTQACMRFSYEPPYEVRPDHFLLADLFSLKRILGLAAEPVPVHVRTAIERPRCAREVERLLGPGVEFGATGNEIVFPKSALSLPLDRRARDRVCRGREPCVTTPETGRRVAAVIHDDLEFEPLNLPEVARRLGMNLRTVQRHLAVWGVTFEAVLDDYRRQHAVALLREGGHTVTDVAFRLGYSDSAHFSRAFKRWFGVSPAAFAAQSSRGGGDEPLAAAF